MTIPYVRVDDLYERVVRPQMPASGGPPPRLSDSEVLCLGLAAQWRSGVVWKSERGFLRYACRYLRPLFPGLTSQSALNRRWRRLWGGFTPHLPVGAGVLLQQAVAQELVTAQECEVMDCVPVPVAHGAHSFHPGWLADIARIGKGGNDRYSYGLHLLVVASASGLATGWTLRVAAGNIQDRWLADGLFSARAGYPQLTGPALPDNQAEPRLPAPTDWMGPAQSCGQHTGRPVIADNGFTAADWQPHWAQPDATQVEAPPETDRPAQGRWFSSLRQVIETVFAHLDDRFGLKYPGAHTTWGLLTRIAAQLAAYNLGLWINRACGRPDFSFATLIL